MKTRLFQGIKVVVDRPKGFVQTGKDKSGKPWMRVYKTDYGYIPGTDGGDGEELDVFLGPREKERTVYVIWQNKDDGAFDELKLFMGFANGNAAMDCYRAHIPAKYMGGLTEANIELVKALLGKKPMAKAASLSTMLRVTDPNRMQRSLERGASAMHPALEEEENDLRRAYEVEARERGYIGTIFGGIR